MSYRSDPLWEIVVKETRVTVELQTWRTTLGQDSKHREMVERGCSVFIRSASTTGQRMDPAEVIALRGALQTAQEVADHHNATMVRKENV